MILQNKKNTENQPGFTLLEVLISMTILTIGLLAIAGMHITAMRGNKAASEMTEAANVALVNFENLLASDYDAVKLVDADGDDKPDVPIVYPAGFPECTLDTGGKITGGGKLVNVEGADDAGGKYLICYKILTNDDDSSTLSTYEHPGLGTFTTTLETHVAWYSDMGCKDSDETDTSGCSRTITDSNGNKFQFNKERIIKNIVPFINKKI